MSDKLFKYRKKIDKIDNKIINLLSKRFINVKKIGELKQLRGIPINDSGREEKIIERLYQLDGQALPQEHIKLIFETIFKISKDNQKEI